MTIVMTFIEAKAPPSVICGLTAIWPLISLESPQKGQNTPDP